MLRKRIFIIQHKTNIENSPSKVNYFLSRFCAVFVHFNAIFAFIDERKALWDTSSCLQDDDCVTNINKKIKIYIAV